MAWLERQSEALSHLSRHSEVGRVLYGGAAGSGKSELGCRWQIQRRMKYPGTRSVIGRNEFQALRTSTMHTLFKVIGSGYEHSPGFNLQAGKHYVYNGSSHTLRFSNGSEIIFKDLGEYPSDPNFDTLGSLEITDYFIDECTEISQRAANILHSRCRYMLREYNLTPKGLLTCNPAKGWVYNDIYLPWRNNALPDSWRFVQALPSDNPFLPESYINALNQLPEYDRQRLLLGNWEYDDDVGALFKTDDVLRCFRNEAGQGQRYITADIARFGKDRTVVCVWHGLTLVDLRQLRRADTQEVVRVVRELMTKHNVILKNVIADEDGIGGGTVDALRCRGFMNGSKANKHERYVNLKAECYFKLAELVEQGKVVFMAGEKSEIVREFEMIRRHHPDKDTRLSVTPKEELKRRYGLSPDIMDAIMMRCYWEVSNPGGPLSVMNF
jgi:phage terminase large subunit